MTNFFLLIIVHYRLIMRADDQAPIHDMLQGFFLDTLHRNASYLQRCRCGHHWCKLRKSRTVGNRESYGFMDFAASFLDFFKIVHRMHICNKKSTSISKFVHWKVVKIYTLRLPCLFRSINTSKIWRHFLSVKLHSHNTSK